MACSKTALNFQSPEYLFKGWIEMNYLLYLHIAGYSSVLNMLTETTSKLEKLF